MCLKCLCECVFKCTCAYLRCSLQLFHLKFTCWHQASIMFFTDFESLFHLNCLKPNSFLRMCVNKINAFIDSFPNQTFSKIQKNLFLLPPNKAMHVKMFNWYLKQTQWYCLSSMPTQFLKSEYLYPLPLKKVGTCLKTWVHCTKQKN